MMPMWPCKPPVLSTRSFAGQIASVGAASLDTAHHLGLLLPSVILRQLPMSFANTLPAFSAALCPNSCLCTHEYTNMLALSGQSAWSSESPDLVMQGGPGRLWPWRGILTGGNQAL